MASEGSGVGSSSASEYSYDDAERLIAVVGKSGTGANVQKSEYGYDGLSRLRVSREYSWAAGAWVQSSEKRRVYDGMNVVQERDENNAPVAFYTRGADMGGGIGGLLARSTPAGDFFYHYDGRGNVVQMSDAAQATVAEYKYSAFGNLISSSGAQAAGNPYRFSSKEFHSNTGLYDYGYRFYSPSLGRWINRDPIAETGGLNLNQFVLNDPINKRDPNGLWVWIFVIAVGWVLVDQSSTADPPSDATGIHYGNYCGFFNRGPGDPKDAIDAACEKHDACIAGPKEWLTPGTRPTCDADLAQDANDASASGCDSAPDPKACRKAAREVEDWASAGGGTAILPPVDITPPRGGSSCATCR